MMNNNSLITTLKALRGNARGCVYTEPLWGIPFNLYAPYVSVYMLAFGLTDAQIGLVTSFGLVLQIFWALMSGAITDKLGRKRTTLIADLISWTVPCLIWAFAQNFTWFLTAAVFSSLWRISMTSWQCLLVEDTDPALLVDIWSWIYISGLVVAFVAPLGGLLIQRFGLVPTMRGLYLLAFVMMTVKFLVMNGMVTETRQGLVRMQETKGQSVFAVLGESSGVLKQVLHSPVILLAVGIMLVLSISQMVRGTFWSILVTEKLQIPADRLSLYFSARSIIMLGIFFLVMPRLRNKNVYGAMFVGFFGLLLSQIMLISVPVGNALMLVVTTLLEAAAFPIASALMDTTIAIVVEAKERARIMAIVYVMVILLTSPFGWIAGQMSSVDRTLPFVLNIVLYGVAVLLTFLIGRLTRNQSQAQALVEETAQA